MELNLRWLTAFRLYDAARTNGIYGTDLERIPASPGIYVFCRSHGETVEALYVGKANSLSTRIGQQLNNARLMMGIKNATNGTRRLLVAEFLPRPGQRTETCLAVIEQTLIRHYLSLGHDLLNVQGTRIVHHVVKSERDAFKDFIPRRIYGEA